jgi:hypothetical protein
MYVNPVRSALIKPDLLAYTHVYQVIKRRFTPKFVFVIVLFCFSLQPLFFI